MAGEAVAYVQAVSPEGAKGYLGRLLAALSLPVNQEGHTFP